MPGVERIVLSASGTAAVLYRSDPQRIETIVGLPQNPTVAGGVDLPDAAVAMAVSDDGDEVLLATSTSVARVSRTGGIRHAVSAETRAVAYVPHTRDALVAERSGRLLLIRSAGEQTILLMGDGESFGEPVAIAADGERAFVAFASRMAVVPLDGSTAETLECSCTITSLDRMNGDSVFRLTEIGSGPLWLLDKTRIVFVPAAGGVQ
jgi:hypothetical protein